MSNDASAIYGFDDECRDAKRATCRLGRATASACRRSAVAIAAAADAPSASGRYVAAATAAQAARYSQRRAYRLIRHQIIQMCRELWRKWVKSFESDTRQLSQTVDQILGHSKLKT